MKERHSQIDIMSHSRAFVQPGGYMVMPRVNRVMSRLPQFRETDVQVLATPDIGARFVQHELIFQPGGGTVQPIRDELEHFFYVLEGRAELSFDGGSHTLDNGGFAYLPPSTEFSLHGAGEEDTRALWIRRRFLPYAGPCPAPVVGNERDIPDRPGQKLLPFDRDPAYDMGMLIVNVEPGRGISQVEIHVMQHGLYMLQGQGIYWLNKDYHEVQADDFIYFAPYCPQYFYATGEETGRYLLFKEVNRDYDSGL